MRVRAGGRATFKILTAGTPETGMGTGITLAGLSKTIFFFRYESRRRFCQLLWIIQKRPLSVKSGLARPQNLIAFNIWRHLSDYYKVPRYVAMSASRTMVAACPARKALPPWTMSLACPVRPWSPEHKYLARVYLHLASSCSALYHGRRVSATRSSW